MLEGLTPELIQKISKDRRLLQWAYNWFSNPIHQIKPRSDNPAEYDEQTSFLTDQFEGMAVALGGTGSGKTLLGALKLARFLFTTDPPRKNCPVWVVGKTFNQSCGVCWQEKLSNFITPDMRQNVHWYNQAQGWAQSVVMKPNEQGNNWVIEFKSAESDRERFQGHSIAALWVDEQIPFSLIPELMGRMRDYNYPGSAFYTLCPVNPDEQLEARFNKPEDFPGWRFYRMNSRLNAHICQERLDELIDSEVEQLKDTRLTGAFGSFYGVIYQTFNPKVHVISPKKVPRLNWHVRGIDLGFSDPTVCLWMGKDHDGRWYVYDEYYQNKATIRDHIEAINEVKWDYTAPEYGPTYADYGGGGAQILHEFRREGLNTEPAMKDQQAGIATVQKALKIQGDGKPRLFITANCKKLIQEMRSYSWHPTQRNKPGHEFSHGPDCVRYVIFSDRQEQYGKPVLPLNIPRRRDSISWHV